VNLQSVNELRYLLGFFCKFNELKFARFSVASLEEAAEVGRIKIQEHKKMKQWGGSLDFDLHFFFINV
jgi:hypothetical protein